MLIFFHKTKTWLFISLVSCALLAVTGCPNSVPLPDGGSENNIEVAQETSSDAATEKAPEETPETVLDMALEKQPEVGEPSPEQILEATAEIAPEILPESQTCQAAPPQQAGEIPTDQGTMRGTQEDGVWNYKGIPYAAPPVGPLRWKPPQSPACWKDIRLMDRAGEVCPQTDARGNLRGSEDCLFLNIWRPAQATPQQTRPVMFFIHGGGNVQGSSTETVTNTTRLIYDGQQFAKQHDVIVVTLNYRIGALGYLALPELAQESTRKISGNYGFLDQVFALQWVQRNIQAFGGDPKQVMIFGESAGAVNTCAHLASPLSKGLFHAALMQSGGCGARAYQAAEDAGKTLADKSPCKNETDRLACLRNKGTSEVLQIFPGEIGITRLQFGNTDRDYGPLIDGYALTKHPTQAILAKEHNAVPFVIGSNADEYESLLSPTITVPTQAAYEGYVTSILKQATPAELSEVLKLYDVNNYATPRDALVDFLSDFAFNCPTRSYAKALSQAQAQPVWRYFFSRRPKLPNREGRASHGIELLYVFQSLVGIPLYTPDPIDLKISNNMMYYWAHLAKMRDPNGASPPSPWTAYDPNKDNTLQIDEPLKMIEGVRTDRCNLLEKIAFP